MEKSGKFVKEYPKVGTLTWKEKQRLIDLVDIPRASVSGVRMSPRKLRIVADAIRGKHVDEALGILRFLPNSAAPVLHKLLESAIANAGNVHEMKADKLFVGKVLVDGGPTMKRFMARARGRACRIRKRTSSALIVLREKVDSYKKLFASTSASTSGKKEGEK
ncbi:MAG: 50S ribosomal protein L22 [Candidatus Riflebacteria bacterium]|nr:50S ribosomal protein L22 [Candidatus Riflebacteria bacterium]